MPVVVLYMQMHQPHRLRRRSIFDRDLAFFDDALNRRICTRVAERCYRPVLALLLDLVRRHDGRFRFCLSATGSVLEQLRACAPGVIDRLAELASTGCCEILGETAEHSLASVHDEREFREQVDRHERLVGELLGARPRVFRNTELIYSDRIAELVGSVVDASGRPRFRGILAEGVDRLADREAIGRVHRAAAGPLGVLLRDSTLSDDIGFRFSDRSWPGYPLTPGAHAESIAAAGGEVRLLGLDIETFGEHHAAESGILRFLAAWPAAALERGLSFATASEALEAPGSGGVYGCPEPTSWADRERDLSAWAGNAMQRNAAAELYRIGRGLRELAGSVRGRKAAAVEAWRRLTASDHVYYMATKEGPDGGVHRHFSPYGSPHEAYTNFVLVLDRLREEAPVGAYRDADRLASRSGGR